MFKKEVQIETLFQLWGHPRDVHRSKKFSFYFCVAQVCILFLCKRSFATIHIERDLPKKKTLSRRAPFESPTTKEPAVNLKKNLALLGAAAAITAATFALYTPSQSVAQNQAKKAPPPKVQIAILLDTSSSMSGLIHQTRTQLWRIVNEFGNAQQGDQRPVVELSVYEYGKSTLSPATDYIQQLSALTTDLDSVSEQLFALRTNGGSEYAGSVCR